MRPCQRPRSTVHGMPSSQSRLPGVEALGKVGQGLDLDLALDAVGRR